METYTNQTTGSISESTSQEVLSGVKRLLLRVRLVLILSLLKLSCLDKNQSHSSQKSQYRIRLEEKAKLRFHYGLTERQLLKYVRIAGKAKGSTGQVLLQLLEMRLDNIIFRLGIASTIPQARQLVNHRHIFVNGGIVDIPSYRCKPRDIITAKDEQKSRALIQNSLDSSPSEEVPKHLTLHPFQYKGVVNQIIDSKSMGLKINELLVVEYYSRQT